MKNTTMRLRNLAIREMQEIMEPDIFEPGTPKSDEKLLKQAEKISSQADFLRWARNASWDAEAARRAMSRVGVKMFTNKALRILHADNWDT